MVDTHFPGFATPLEAARFLVLENRLHELSLEHLSPADREVLLGDLRKRLVRARLHMIEANLIGIALTACFLLLGGALLSIGPAEFFGAFRLTRGNTLITDRVVIWIVIVTCAVLGAVSTHYVLRRRLQIAKLWGHDSHQISQTIHRIKEGKG